MSIQLQINEYMEWRNTELVLEGKRAIHKDTGWLCTIKKVQIFDEGTRYTVHFDHQPEKLLQVIWGDGLVIIGEVQY